MDYNKINQIPQHDAETIEDRLLLGLIHTEAKRIEFGKIVIELSVRNGTIDRVTMTELSRIVNIGMRKPGAQI